MVGGAAAIAGCLLPWERLRFSGVGLPEHTAVLSVLHGSGIAACGGAVLGLGCIAHRLVRPATRAVRDALCAGAGALLIAGAGLFTTSGGYRPASGPGYSVSLGPGLLCAGIAGVAFIAASLITAHGAGATPSPSTSDPSRPKRRI